MKVIYTDKVEWFKASAITIWPFIFINSVFKDEPSLLVHELVHYKQQQRWAIYGLGIGLIAWFLLYLLALPVGWNPFRKKWETEAYQKGQGYPVEVINNKLKQAPYYLWWM